MSDKKISLFVNQFIPNFIVREHPKLVMFLKKYLEYSERYNEVKTFTLIDIKDGDYDPTEVGLNYVGYYLEVSYDSEEVLKGLAGNLIKGAESDAIYKVDSVVYSSLDNKYLLQATRTGNQRFELGETIAEVDIGEYTRISDLILYRDIDETIEEFIDLHSSEYLYGISSNISTDIRVLIKHIRQFYRSKGTEESFKFLFRAIFNAEVSFYYPRDDILRASAGNWYQPYLVTLTDNTGIDDFENKAVRGFTSRARGDVNGVLRTYDGLGEIVDIFLEVDMDSGVLLVGEDLSDISDGTITGEIASVELTAGRWTNNDGHLSSTKVLQDNYFYQDFSYVLKTDVSITLFEDLIKKLIHPAGMLMFGQFIDPGATVLEINLTVFGSLFKINNISDELEVNLTSTSTSNILSELTSEFFDTTYVKIEAGREEYPYGLLFDRVDQLYNIKVGDFDEFATDPAYIVPDSTLIINN